MRLEDARRLIGQRIAVNANGGSLVTGKLIAVCESPSIILEVPSLDRQQHVAITAVDGWVTEGTPPRFGGKEVSG